MSCNSSSTSEALRTDDLVISQGASWGRQWPIVNTDGSPASLIGYTIRAQMRKSVVDDDVLYEWSNDLGNAYFDANKVTLIVEPEVSSAWTWIKSARKFSYDIELVSPTGAVVRVTQGHIRIDPEVTR